ncbi:MAG: CBS domain-containing protein, partial [Firmicutes bacterium]|nr:CBS domain-containing protein [Bacillota bacterium]
PATPLSEIMTERVVPVGHDADLEKVKEIFVKYDFLALPVTGDDGKLLGVITVDDAIDLILAKRRRTALGRLRKGA